MLLIARAGTTSSRRDEQFDINNLSATNLCVNFATTSLFSKYEHNKTIIVGKVW